MVLEQGIPSFLGFWMCTSQPATMESNIHKKNQRFFILSSSLFLTMNPLSRWDMTGSFIKKREFIDALIAGRMEEKVPPIFSNDGSAVTVPPSIPSLVGLTELYQAELVESLWIETKTFIEKREFIYALVKSQKPWEGSCTVSISYQTPGNDFPCCCC